MLYFLTDRAIAELLFWWAGVAMPIATVTAILYARAQLTVIASQAQATLLLNLIDKWNSEKMHQGRAALDVVEATAKSTIFTQHVGLSEKECNKKLQEHFRITMAGIDNTDRQKYTSMLEVMSFFELVGQLVKRRYILLTDIDGLFRCSELHMYCILRTSNKKEASRLVITRTLFSLFLKLRKFALTEEARAWGGV